MNTEKKQIDRKKGTYLKHQIHILQLVKSGVHLVADIAKAVGVHTATVSIHLQDLKDRGDVKRYIVCSGQARTHVNEFVRDSKGILKGADIFEPVAPKNMLPCSRIIKLEDRKDSWWQREARKSPSVYVSGSTLSSAI